MLANGGAGDSHGPIWGVGMLNAGRRHALAGRRHALAGDASREREEMRCSSALRAGQGTQHGAQPPGGRGLRRLSTNCSFSSAEVKRPSRAEVSMRSLGAAKPCAARGVNG